MTEEKVCAEGHVIDGGRETCSRDNLPPVSNTVPADPVAEAVEDAKEAVIDEETGAPEGAEVVSREEAEASGVDVEKVEDEGTVLEDEKKEEDAV